MFGECHGHLFMNGENYRQAVALHEAGVNCQDVRKKLEQYRREGISFSGTEEITWVCPGMPGRLPGNMGLITGRPCLPFTKTVIMGKLWAGALTP